MLQRVREDGSSALDDTRDWDAKSMAALLDAYGAYHTKSATSKEMRSAFRRDLDDGLREPCTVPAARPKEACTFKPLLGKTSALSLAVDDEDEDSMDESGAAPRATDSKEHILQKTSSLSSLSSLSMDGLAVGPPSRKDEAHVIADTDDAAPKSTTMQDSMGNDYAVPKSGLLFHKSVWIVSGSHLHAGLSHLSIVCCLLSVACRQLSVVVHCMLSVVSCLRSVVCCLPSVIRRRPLSVVCCLLSVVCCLLSAVCCLLPAVSCTLSSIVVVCCLLSVVCCLLSVVCCLLSVVCGLVCCLPVVCCLLSVVCCVSPEVNWTSSSVVCCLLSVVCCLSSVERRRPVVTSSIPAIHSEFLQTWNLGGVRVHVPIC